MIEIPTVTDEQQQELLNLTHMAGWKHLIDPIKVSAELTEAALINFEFKRDDDGRMSAKSIGEYEKKQLQLVLLKEFLNYVENGGIVFTEENMETYE